MLVEDAIRDHRVGDKVVPTGCTDSRRSVSLQLRTESEQLRDRCYGFGMHPSAVDGWLKYHIHPARPMICFFLAQGWILAVILYMLTGAPLSRYYYSIPLIVAMMPHIAHTGAVWIWGPGFAVGRLFFASLPVFMLGTTIPTISSYLGRSENMPFGNSAHFTVVMGCFWMGRIVSNKTGMLGELGGMQCCCAVV